MFFNYFVTVNDAAAPYRAIVFAIYEIAKVYNLSLIYKFYLQFIVIITYSPSNRKMETIQPILNDNARNIRSICVRLKNKKRRQSQHSFTCVLLYHGPIWASVFVKPMCEKY